MTIGERSQRPESLSAEAGAHSSCIDGVHTRFA